MAFYGQIFEIGSDPSGTSDLQNWVNELNDLNDGVTLMAVVGYEDDQNNYVACLAAPSGTYGFGQFQANMFAATFDIRNGLADVLNWLNTLNPDVFISAVISKRGEEQLLLTVIVAND